MTSWRGVGLGCYCKSRSQSAYSLVPRSSVVRLGTRLECVYVWGREDCASVKRAGPYSNIRQARRYVWGHASLICVS